MTRTAAHIVDRSLDGLARAVSWLWVFAPFLLIALDMFDLSLGIRLDFWDFTLAVFLWLGSFIFVGFAAACGAVNAIVVRGELRPMLSELGRAPIRSDPSVRLGSPPPRI